MEAIKGRRLWDFDANATKEFSKPIKGFLFSTWRSMQTIVTRRWRIKEEIQWASITDAATGAFEKIGTRPDASLALSKWPVPGDACIWIGVVL
ncbi:hypothetical protein PIB30_041901 [Stylosanthes scabra]|uniref:Uncharacterized protein n=1 Tax=Stylosanthes scabra TaxID=79078 RepID=A0ABU6ZDW0_9FABA|nr:hypothetical protein [Stylosanthes scabra]